MRLIQKIPNMKKFFFALAFFAVFAIATSGQEYQTALGYRGGLSNGLTVKHFLTSDVALEGLLTARFGGYNITGLYEIHTQPFSISGLYFYYGFGGHLGSWQNGPDKVWWNDERHHSVIGIDGIVGLEYYFGTIPFNISLDYKPGFNLIGYPTFWGDEFSLSIRYVWGNR
jgi:hypothetical protein